MAPFISHDRLRDPGTAFRYIISKEMSIELNQNVTKNKSEYKSIQANFFTNYNPVKYSVLREFQSISGLNKKIGKKKKMKGKNIRLARV